MPRWLEPFASRIPAFRDLDLLMDQAGLKGHLPTFLLSTIGLTVGIGLGTLIVTRYMAGSDTRRHTGGTFCRMPTCAGGGASGCTPSRSSSRRPSTCSAGRSARGTRSPPGSRWWRTRPPSLSPVGVPAHPRGEPVRAPLRGRAPSHGRPGEHRGRPHPHYRNPDPARGGRQPGRGARQPRECDSGALQHPPAAPGVHRPGPVQRLRPGLAPDRHQGRPSTR